MEGGGLTRCIFTGLKPRAAGSDPAPVCSTDSTVDCKLFSDFLLLQTLRSR